MLNTKIPRQMALQLPAEDQSTKKQVESELKHHQDTNPDTAPAVKHAFQRYKDGVGANTIARELNEMGFRSQQGKLFYKNTIRTWFQNPFPFAGC